MLTIFFALILMFAVNPALVPHSMKPDGITYRGSSKPAVVPNFWIKGPAAVTDTVVTDSTCTITPEPTRADSLEQGLVDPTTFTPEEFEQQKERAQDLWLKRKQFLNEVNGFSEIPKGWT
jgi:hypothetical protein